MLEKACQDLWLQGYIFITIPIFTWIHFYYYTYTHTFKSIRHLWNIHTTGPIVLTMRNFQILYNYICHRHKQKEILYWHC
jgi:hypothetical protein